VLKLREVQWVRMTAYYVVTVPTTSSFVTLQSADGIGGASTDDVDVVCRRMVIVG